MDTEPRPSGGPPAGLTDAERGVLALLAEAWDRFNGLPVVHPADAPEFRSAIHAAQNILACRVAQRVDPEIWFIPRTANGDAP